MTERDRGRGRVGARRLGDTRHHGRFGRRPARIPGSPGTRGARGRVAAAAVVGAVALAGCSDAPAGPDLDAASWTVVAGADQEGLEGRPLPGEVVLRLVDASGVGLAGRSVDPPEVTGGGSVALAARRTEPSGRLALTWTLGPAGAGPQRVRIRAGAAEVVLAAAALPESAGDLLVVRGARGPLKGAVVLAADPRFPADPAEAVASLDTLIRLQPRAGGSDDLVVLPWDNPPERGRAVWTPGVDTVEVVLRPPVEVTLTVTVHVSPLAAKVAEFEADLDALRTVVRQEGLGLEVGDVEVVDRSQVGDTVAVTGSEVCTSPGPVSRVQVQYVHRITQYWGYACPPGWIWMSDERRPTAPWLFPHEVGHVLSLPHTTRGLMNPSASESGLTEGEILRAHFSPISGLNATFGALPPSERGFCDGVGVCVPLDFELGVRPPGR